MKNTNRFYYIDLVKALAICFVCMYHFWYGGSIAYAPDMTVGTVLRRFLSCILSTCVPLFLVASGAMLLNKPFQAKHHFGALLRLFVQFWVWRSVTILILGLSRGYDFRAQGMQGIVNLFFLFNHVDGIDLSHTWFIPMLCCIYLLMPFYKRLFDAEGEDANARWPLILLLGLIYLLNFLTRDFSFFQPHIPQLQYLETHNLSYFDPFYSRTGIMSLYFILGGFLHKYRRQLGKIPALACIAIILTGMAGLTAQWYAICTHTGTNYDIIFGGYDTTATLLCTVGLFLLAAKCEPFLTAHTAAARLCSRIGSNTIYIYYIHWILGHTLLRRLPLGHDLISNTLKTALFVAAGTLVGCILQAVKKTKSISKC